MFSYNIILKNQIVKNIIKILVKMENIDKFKFLKYKTTAALEIF